MTIQELRQTIHKAEEDAKIYVDRMLEAGLVVREADCCVFLNLSRHELKAVLEEIDQWSALTA